MKSLPQAPTTTDLSVSGGWTCAYLRGPCGDFFWARACEWGRQRRRGSTPRRQRRRRLRNVYRQ